METTLSHHSSASFWDRIAEKYAKRPVKDPVAYADKLHAVRALVKQTDTMLEIGCGTGTTALTLAPSVATYTATDISPAMIGIARAKRQDQAAGNVHFEVADATKVVSSAPFYVVAAFSLLHLVDDLPAVLRSIHDQLRPGGIFVSKTVCLGEANVGIRLFVKTLTAIGLAPRVLSLRQAELKAALLRAGFVIEERRYFGNRRTSPFFVARRPD